MSRHKSLLFILLLVIGAVVIDLPTRWQPKLDLAMGPIKLKRDFALKQGLDIAGGVHLALEADMSQIAAADREEALKSVAEIVRRRVDLFGVSEAVVQTAQANDQYRVIAELPGLTNVNQAISLIGQTAQLSFREEIPQASPSALTARDFKPTDLTGKDLTRARVEFDQTTGQPQVALEFNSEGKQKFADLTRRNIGKPVAIFLDELPVTVPVVKQEITAGNAVITGNFTVDQAKTLAVQLNAGALPAPIKIIEQRNVGATLGKESVAKSIRAGLVGLALVTLFMIGNYGGLGVIAVVALTIYGVVMLAIYKLVPITLSLPGITGFILSVGMAVDSNILIFERFKEEKRQGNPWAVAIERAFDRAWGSIKDANLAALTTAFILLNPFDWSWLPTSGLVRGFALTLALGIGLSLFTGIWVSRTLIRTFYREREAK